MTSIIEQIEGRLAPYDYLTPIQRNLLMVMEEHGPTERRSFVKLLNIPRTTVYDNLLKLQNHHIIEKFKFNNGKRGAPVVYWRIKKYLMECGIA